MSPTTSSLSSGFSGAPGTAHDRRRRLTQALPVLALLAMTGACTSSAPPQPQANSQLKQIMSAPVAAPARQCSRPNAEVLKSIVRVASVDGADASGVVIAPNRVLTAAHVVDDHYRALVYINSEYRDALVVATDPSTDLALLAVTTDHLQPIRVSHHTLLVEEPDDCARSNSKSACWSR